MRANWKILGNTPQYLVHAVFRRGDKTVWTNIGECSPHNDGEGFFMKLTFVPAGETNLVIRKTESSDEANERGVKECRTGEPTHRVVAVVTMEEHSFWSEIGALWPHSDGKGFNMELNLLPNVPAELIIRTQAIWHTTDSMDVLRRTTGRKLDYTGRVISLAHVSADGR
jgi:hypothetical protein